MLSPGRGVGVNTEHILDTVHMERAAAEISTDSRAGWAGWAGWAVLRLSALSAPHCPIVNTSGPCLLHTVCTGLLYRMQFCLFLKLMKENYNEILQQPVFVE